MPSGLTKLRIPQTSATIASGLPACAPYVPSVTDTRGVYDARREDFGMDPTVERFLRAGPLGEARRPASRGDVEEFASWLRGRGQTVEDVDGRVLAEYTSLLGASRPGRNPRRLAPATIARKLAAVRSFLRFTLGPA